LGHLPVSLDAAEGLLALSMPAAVQRSTICPSRQRVTLQLVVRAMEIIDSPGLGEAGSGNRGLPFAEPESQPAAHSLAPSSSSRPNSASSPGTIQAKACSAWATHSLSDTIAIRLNAE